MKQHRRAFANAAAEFCFSMEDASTNKRIAADRRLRLSATRELWMNVALSRKRNHFAFFAFFALYSSMYFCGLSLNSDRQPLQQT